MRESSQNRPPAGRAPDTCVGQPVQSCYYSVLRTCLSSQNTCRQLTKPCVSTGQDNCYVQLGSSPQSRKQILSGHTPTSVPNIIGHFSFSTHVNGGLRIDRTTSQLPGTHHRSCECRRVVPGISALSIAQIAQPHQDLLAGFLTLVSKWICSALLQSATTHMPHMSPVSLSTAARQHKEAFPRLCHAIMSQGTPSISLHPSSR